MESMLATPADAGIILKLYELRTEATMRAARAGAGDGADAAAEAADSLLIGGEELGLPAGAAHAVGGDDGLVVPGVAE